MRFIHAKRILSAVVLLAALPLWAAERTGALLNDYGDVRTTKEDKAIKKEQDSILKMLIAGNKRHMAHMTRGGNPQVMVVSCADSHVEPAVVFGVKPSDIFTIRAYGNIVDKVILASLEYGADGKDTGKDGLNIHVLVVMGHTDCTAIKGAIQEHDNPRTEDQWDSLNQKALYEELEPSVADIEEAQRESEAQTGKQLQGENLLEAVVRENVLNTMHQIRQKSPLLWHLEQKDYLKTIGCIYHKDSGKVEWIKE